MSLKRRLDKLKHTTLDKHAYAGAKELLQVRFNRADAVTKGRLLRVLAKRLESANSKKC